MLVTAADTKRARPSRRRLALRVEVSENFGVFVTSRHPPAKLQSSPLANEPTTTNALGAWGKSQATNHPALLPIPACAMESSGGPTFELPNHMTGDTQPHWTIIEPATRPRSIEADRAKPEAPRKKS